MHNVSLTFISEYNQTYETHTSCYYCLELTLCYQFVLFDSVTFFGNFLDNSKYLWIISSCKDEIFSSLNSNVIKLTHLGIKDNLVLGQLLLNYTISDVIIFFHSIHLWAWSHFRRFFHRISRLQIRSQKSHHGHGST